MQLPRQRLIIDAAVEDVEVRIDGSQLHQIFWNLCQNSVTHALPPAGDAPIELRYGRLGGVGRPYLQVADRGPGIAQADAERIFEPFFTRARAAPDSACSWRASWPAPTAPRCCMRRARAVAASFASYLPTRADGATYS